MDSGEREVFCTMNGATIPEEYFIKNHWLELTIRISYFKLRVFLNPDATITITPIRSEVDFRMWLMSLPIDSYAVVQY